MVVVEGVGLPCTLRTNSWAMVLCIRRYSLPPGMYGTRVPGTSHCQLSMLPGYMCTGIGVRLNMVHVCVCTHARMFSVINCVEVLEIKGWSYRVKSVLYIHVYTNM